jgi:NADPH-dependent 7-cyano-7-deazaguanine reductase QueF
MKMRNTNEDLTAAIMRAIVTVIAPSEICVSVTEVRVSIINPASTYRNVL